MEHWKHLQQLILSEEYKYIHKMIWEEMIIVTDKGGRRFKITETCSLAEVRDFMQFLKEFRYGYNFIKKGITNIVMLSLFSFIFTSN